jgi:hypothetical protein
MILIMSDGVQLAFAGTDKLSTGWDDDCPGLVATKVREAVWRERQDRNDKEFTNWAVEAPDGWGGVEVDRLVNEEG